MERKTIRRNKTKKRQQEIIKQKNKDLQDQFEKSRKPNIILKKIQNSFPDLHCNKCKSILYTKNENPLKFPFEKNEFTGFKTAYQSESPFKMAILYKALYSSKSDGGYELIRIYCPNCNEILKQIDSRDSTEKIYFC